MFSLDDRNLGSLELLELDSFDTAFAVSATRGADTRRRFMTLFVDTAASRSYGSTGYVCKAYNALGEVFAVKRLRANHATTPLPGEGGPHLTQGQKAAFEEEYKAQLPLSHMRGFPRLYGLGYVGEEPLIVMEWVEGVTLEQARVQLPQAGDGVDPQVVAHLGMTLAEILEGLDHLSQRPVHRDISPRNIMFRTHARSLQEQVNSLDFDLCLIDFGSATVASEDNARFTMLTDVWRNGTPEYAPPEMLTHDIAGVEQLRQSPSIDVYATASVLYELLVGHTPFRIAEAQGKSPYRVKTESELAPLPERFGALGQAIMWGLQRQQDARCAAAQLGALCSQYLGLADASAIDEMVVPGAVAGQQTELASQMPEWIPETEPFESAHFAVARGPNTMEAPSRAAADMTPGALSTPNASDTARAALQGANTARTPDSTAVPSKSQHPSRRGFLVASGALLGLAAVGGLAFVVRNLGSAGDSQDISTSDTGEATSSESSTIETVPYSGGTLLLAQDASTMRWGYVNSGREWVIAPTFEQMPGFFSEGLAFAQDPQTKLYGFIDYEGTWAIEPRFASAGTFYADGLAPVQASGEYGDLLGWIDIEGRWAITPFCESGGAFQEGLAPFSLNAANSTSPLYGYVDATGNIAIDPQFYDAHAFTSDGLAACAQHVSQWGWIDRTGGWVIEPRFARAGNFSDGLASALDATTEHWGYVGKDGALIIEPTFQSARGFANGLAAVQDADSNLWGCIDSNGAWVIEPSFVQLGEFSHGLAPAQDAESELFGYIDDQGQWVIPPTFAAVGLPALE